VFCPVSSGEKEEEERAEGGDLRLEGGGKGKKGRPRIEEDGRGLVFAG